MPRRERDQAASAKVEAAFSRFFFKHAAASRVYLDYGRPFWLPITSDGVLRGHHNNGKALQTACRCFPLARHISRVFIGK